MRALAAITLSAATLLAVQAVAAETHPFNVRDMQSMDRVTDPALSPDGRLVVFKVTSTDLDANKRSSSLWVVHTDGTGLRRLTAAGTAKDDNPRFARDGKVVWFVSNRSGSEQVWRIAVDGGEAERVTDEPLPVASLVVAPDGTRIAYAMPMFPDCATPACTKGRLDEVAARKATGRIYDSLMVRHWDAWADGTRSHIFVRGVARGAAAVNVMRGMNADAPTTPFGGPEEIAFTPDARSIVFSAKDAGEKEAWSTNVDLFLAPCDGSAAPTTRSSPGATSSPSARLGPLNPV